MFLNPKAGITHMTPYKQNTCRNNKNHLKSFKVVFKVFITEPEKMSKLETLYTQPKTESLKILIISSLLVYISLHNACSH